MSVDRLDGTAKSGCLFEVFTCPGRVILWLQYMSASTKPGHSGMIAQTQRRANSPIMSVLYSLAFWTAVGFCAYAYLTVPTSQPPAPTPSIKITQDYLPILIHTYTPKND